MRIVIDTEQQWAGLMRAANAGDASAYAAFLRSVTPHLRRFVSSGLDRARAGSADGEDIVQEILLALHLKRHTWRDGEPIRPWIFAIGRYKLIDALRRRWRRAEIDIADLGDSLAAEAAEPAPTTIEIDRALATLPEGQRRVVTAVSVDGRSIRETSEALDLKEGAVRVALHRGLKALRARFGND